MWKRNPQPPREMRDTEAATTPMNSASISASQAAATTRRTRFVAERASLALAAQEGDRTAAVRRDELANEIVVVSAELVDLADALPVAVQREAESRQREKEHVVNALYVELVRLRQEARVLLETLVMRLPSAEDGRANLHGHGSTGRRRRGHSLQADGAGRTRDCRLARVRCEHARLPGSWPGAGAVSG